MSPPDSTNSQPDRAKLLASFFVLYVVWGSTYLAMRVAIESYPPFLMAGVRYLLAGSSLWAFAKFRGEPWPTLSQARASAIVGLLLMVGGNGLVSYTEQWVSSSIAAVTVASTPLLASLFGGLFGRWPHPREWLGLAIGLVGVVVLNLHGDLRAYPLGAALLVLASASWALGSIWSRHLDMAKGHTATALEMLIGGSVLMGISLARGDRFPASPSVRSSAAILYLIVFGSLIAFSAYHYLLKNVRPQLATSYAYVNPIIAVLLGVGLAGESFGANAWLGMAIILSGVVLVMLGGGRKLPARVASSVASQTTS